MAACKEKKMRSLLENGVSTYRWHRPPWQYNVGIHAEGEEKAAPVYHNAGLDQRPEQKEGRKKLTASVRGA